ncbi:MAG: MlaE family lipid ABC transporter permease subunit [Spirochaeta sp.]
MKQKWNDQTVYLQGALDRGSVPDVIQTLKQKSPSRIDLSGVTDIDLAGAVFLRRIMHNTPELGIPAFRSLPEGTASLYHLIIPDEAYSTPEQPNISFMERLGISVSTNIAHLRDFFQLAADSLYWTVTGLFHPGDRREGAVINHCFTMGVEATGIITLLSAILGFILALQAALQLQQFGAGMMVADLIAITLLHEMGPIMTSIIIAGRSGSATASEIATMKVTEELDALRMLGLHPVRYVVVPKIMAISLVVPMLLTLSIVAGIAGGMVIGLIYLDIHPVSYLESSLSVFILGDFLRSYIKTTVFAWVIVLIGAHYGFHVEGGSEGVGRATTKSVVAAIFAVLVLDALFSLTLL